MLKEQHVLLEMDEAERGAVKEFVNIIEEQRLSSQLLVVTERMRRMADGTLVVPILLSGVVSVAFIGTADEP